MFGQLQTRTAILTDERPLIFLGPRSTCEDLGTWTLAYWLAWPQADILIGGEPRENRRRIRRESPFAAGVYGMVDAQGELIYVGQSKSLRNRLLSYFTAAAPPKAQRIIAHTRRLLWETAPDEFAALLRELELIRRWRPRFNVRGQPDRRRPAYLVLGRGPASHVYLAAEPRKGDRLVFGPVRAGRGCRRAVHALNDYFQLRSCGRRVPMRFAEQQEIFPGRGEVRCLRYDVGNCLAPCASRCSRAEYADRMRAVQGFLGGTDLSALADLEEDMRTAAAAQRYEEAAVLRDTWQALRNLHEQLERYRAAQRHYSFVYPVPNRQGKQTWYLIHRGQVHAALDEPRGRPAADECLALMEQIDAGSTPSVAGATREDTEMTLLIAAWFRAHPHELQRTLSFERVREGLCSARG